MLSRRVWLQLTAFTVITVFGVGTVLAEYLDLRQLLGFSRYELTAEFADSTGLYPGGMVSYRGVEVGKVRSVDLGANTAVATLGIDDDVRIPSSVRAAIRSRSAIGEQSVDLTPRRSGGPWLRPGDRISAADTATMPRADKLITSLHDLAASVPEDALRTVLDELNTGLRGRGPDVATLLASTRVVFARAGVDLVPTTRLIRQLGPFLRTQHELRGPTRSIARDLASFTDRLRRSDRDLRALLAHTPPAVREVTDLQANLQPALPQLLTDLSASGQVVRTQLPGVTQILVLYPAIHAALQRVVQAPGAAPGSAHLGIRYSFNTIPPCYPGFTPMEKQRSFDDLSPAAVPPDQYCKVAPNDPRAVRGARNTPCAAAPSRHAARIEDCGDAGAAAAYVPHQRAHDKPMVGQYDRRTGNALLPDGRLVQLGDARSSQHGKEPGSWRDLLVK